MRPIALCLVAALAMGLLARPAEAGSVINTQVPVSFVLPNPATTDLVFVDGTLHIQLNINNKSGSLQLKAHGKGEGLGSDPIEYIFNGQFKGSLKVPSGASTLSLSLKASLISKGAADNISIDGKLRLHFNANGDLVGIQFDPLLPPKITG